ncbi:MAG: helix-turn-helix transcriptional regulator [Treponema sp.]|nr:helix-turn-helix transcriptional regulator [Treponema sp.]
MSQAKLAEYSGISLPHLIDIEHCKTWVSDRTLKSIALSLNMEVYQLLIPSGEQRISHGAKEEDKNDLRKQIVALINEKSSKLKKSTESTLKDLTIEILHLHS